METEAILTTDPPQTVPPSMEHDSSAENNPSDQSYPSPTLTDLSDHQLSPIFDFRLEVLPSTSNQLESESQEIPPEFNDDLISLGLTPFILGQDRIFNQNRLVSNEALFARTVRQMQTAMISMERARNTNDLELRKLLEASGSVATSTLNPPLHFDFSSLYRAQNETRSTLNNLVDSVTAAFDSTRTIVEDLQKSVHRLKDDVNQSLALSPSCTLLRQGPSHHFMSHALQPTQRTHSTILRIGKTAKVAYGPIASLNRNIRRICEDALRDFGMSLDAIHDATTLPELPRFIKIKFCDYDQAVNFVESVLRARGLDDNALLAFFIED